MGSRDLKKTISTLNQSEEFSERERIQDDSLISGLGNLEESDAIH